MASFSDLVLFDYHLPQGHIAEVPLEKRDDSKLLIVDRNTGKIVHKHFYDLAALLTQRDVLVLNQSKVFPARIYGKKVTGGKVEVLLISQQSGNIWVCISRPGMKPGTNIFFSEGIEATVLKPEGRIGEVLVQFSFPQKTFFQALDAIGKTPVPSYINISLSESELRKKYQTVFAKKVGSAAAPTAGLHFTKELLIFLQEKGVGIEYITLHVGLGTFQSLREEHFTQNALHKEYYEIQPDVAARLNHAKKEGKRIIAVGTTSMRTLESAAIRDGAIAAKTDSTTLFVHPPYRFRFVDSMITNFHLPKSSLLMLISAFTSYPNTVSEFATFTSSYIGNAYQQAIKERYRFFSFGDAMWIT